MARVIVGRDGEWGAIEGALDTAATSPRLVLLDGEAGIGKTHLWRAAVAAARARGHHVLASAPAEVEIGLAYAGLNDLLRDVPEQVFTGLPEPQARALGVALYRSDAADQIPDTTAVAIGTLGLIARLSEQAPVVVAVDDFQWVDPSTSSVLRFVFRRMETAKAIGLVAWRRDRAAAEGPPRDLAPSETVRHVVLGPLSLGALHRVIHDTLRVQLARPTLVRLHEATGGNPYLALELVRAYGAEGADPVAHGAPVPEALRAALARRIASLPRRSREVVAVTALAGRPTLALLDRVLHAGGGAAADLERAERAGLVRRDSGDRVRIDHPLLASFVSGSMAPEVRRALHRRIADAIDDGDGRARHLASAAEGPDEAVALALDEAADRAISRGATVEGAELRELAVAATPQTERARLARRRVALAEASFTAGDTIRARQQLVTALPDAVGDVRLDALLNLATITWFDDESPRAVALAETALAEAGADRAWRARIHARLSWMLDFDVQRQVDHATAALELLDADREPELYAFALLNEAYHRLLAGRGADDEAVERGHRLQERVRSWEFSTIPANWPKAMDRFEVARERLRHYIGRARDVGDESSAAALLTYLGELECWCGDLDSAETLLDEAVGAAEQTGQSVYFVLALARRALVSAYRGDLERARTDAERSRSMAVPPLVPPVPMGVLAFVALTDEDFETVDRLLTEADAMLEGVGMREPAAYRFHADHIEAVVRLGDLARAESLLLRFEERGRVVPRPWILATAARCRGLLSAARGDVRGALVSFDAALSIHETLPMPMERARTLLAHGALLRRVGQRRLALASLERAIELFSGLGCGPWIRRAADELERLGIQRGEKDQLTPSEERIARLAATGITNRVIAERLSISPKTVEASLARAYAKLGIGTRAELGAAFATSDPQRMGRHGVG